MPRARSRPCFFQGLVSLAGAAALAILASVAGTPRGAEAADPAGGDRATSQPAEVARSRVRGDTTVVFQPSPAQFALSRGLAPTWIWGADPNRRYVLRKEFQGGSTGAWLKAAADNRATIFLNGRRVAASESWAEPIEIDVQAQIRPGKNVLQAEVDNEGGPAAFALKLALTLPDGDTRYVVSDESWIASARRNEQRGDAVRSIAKMGDAPWGDAFAKSPETAKVPRDIFEVPEGFQVEHLFTVPRENLGSWVAIAFDPKGRLIASDQDAKGLCRITPPPVGTNQATKVERLDVKISGAQGLLFAFDSLYASINGGPGSGLYRLRDRDGDDQYEEVVKLGSIRGGGEHGPHALRLTPDGKSILIVCGNHTLPPEHLDPGPVAQNWGEDLLLPRQWDANGHARGILAPGGWIAQVDAEGKSWKLISNGYRNTYDIAFNADGELFAYDSDMEWDLGSPWYRPTRVAHATSGSEFGWRSGTGKWPPYYIDSLPPVIDIGPGSPVGVTFGYGAKFPAKYQKALFICDWTFGTIYSIHLEPEGSSYRATKEEFLSRTPLPLTDAAVGPDGALYFTIGGRGTQSELFRVTYRGKEPTDAVPTRNTAGADLRALRHRLEALHRRVDDPETAIAFLWPHLGHADRFIRFAARVALEHQDPKTWQGRVIAERDPATLISGAVALARQGDKALEPKLLEALGHLNFSALDEAKQLDLLRTWSLVFIRMGAPDAATAARISRAIDPLFPSRSDALNRELANVLVYLKSPTIVSKLIAQLKLPTESHSKDVTDLLARNPGYGGTIAKMLANQPEAQKIHYAFVLRNLRDGWTLDERKAYFRWLDEARKWSGGASYPGFINNIDKEAFENSTDAERLAVEASGARTPFRAKELPKAAGPGREWTLESLLTATRGGLKGRDFQHGQKTYAAARCVLCHRFAGDGGATGPDLTQAAGRFGIKDLGEAIIDPGKVVSDQYRASVIATHSGKVYTGRIVSETRDAVSVLIDPEDSTKVVEVRRGDLDEMTPSKVSLMPDKLLNSLNENEVLDLFAYLLSRGDPTDPMFKK